MRVMRHGVRVQWNAGNLALTPVQVSNKWDFNPGKRQQNIYFVAFERWNMQDGDDRLAWAIRGAGARAWACAGQFGCAPGCCREARAGHRSALR